MNCKKCGAEIGFGVTKCPQCGTEIKFSPADYVTAENLEKVTAVCGVLPIAVGVVTGILSIFCGLPLAGVIFEIIRSFIRILAMAVCLISTGFSGYLIAANKDFQNSAGAVAIIGALSGTLSLILMMAGKGIWFLFGLIALAAAAEQLARVFLDECDLAHPVIINNDIAAYKRFFDKAKQANTDEKIRRAGMEQNINSANPGMQPDPNFRSAPNMQPGMPYPGMPMQPMQGNLSYFDGKGLEFLGEMIVFAVFSGLTLGIAVPWLLCRIEEWKASHTVIDGHRLTFNGTGDQLFGLYIKVYLLSLITFGIYGFWGYIEIERWKAKHIFFEEQNPGHGIENSFSGFDADVPGYIGTAICAGLITAFTLGIGTPWAITLFMRWQLGHTIYNGMRLRFEGSAFTLLIEYLIIAVLSCITLGIYSYWGTVKILKWQTSNTHFQMTA